MAHMRIQKLLFQYLYTETFIALNLTKIFLIIWRNKVMVKWVYLIFNLFAYVSETSYWSNIIPKSKGDMCVCVGMFIYVFF